MQYITRLMCPTYTAKGYTLKFISFVQNFYIKAGHDPFGCKIFSPWPNTVSIGADVAGTPIANTGYLFVLVTMTITSSSLS